MTASTHPDSRRWSPLRAPLANQSWSPPRVPNQASATPLPGTKASGSSRVTRVGFAIHGTPADCTRLGLLHLVPEARWILSGINHGANLGADIYYSGTVAAVREALLHGWPGIAFSHYRKSGIEFDWLRATRWITPVLAGLVAKPIESGVFYNVNLPLLPPEAPDPEVVWCPLDPKPLPLNYRHEEESGLYFAGDYSLRLRTPGADVDVCFGGRIAVTAVRLL